MTAIGFVLAVLGYVVWALLRDEKEEGRTCYIALAIGGVGIVLVALGVCIKITFLLWEHFL